MTLRVTTAVSWLASASMVQTRFGAPVQTAGLAPVKVTLGERVAVKVTPVASDPPALAMLTMYAKALPLATDGGALTDAARSACTLLSMRGRATTTCRD